MTQHFPPEERLDSWKEIAVYLDRDMSTVRRWEKEEGLPVHRHVHNKLATVYAYRSEIDAWLANRSGVPHGFRFFSENKKTVTGVAAGITLFLLVGLVTWMDIGSSSNPEVLDFQQRDWVLIADFENRTGEAVFDGVLEYALEREIANSQFVNVVPRERIEDTLRLMRKPLDTHIDREVGKEVALRDGNIRALLTGRVEKLDSTYLLSVQVVDPSQGQAIATASEEAVGQKQVLSALKSLSNWARQNLGEKLALIQESERKLERAATPSLRAVRLFTEARILFDRGAIGQGPAEQLLRQAIEIDPEFASAYIWLAWTLVNQRKPFDNYIQHAERAFQLAGTASEQERYFIHGSYYWMKDEVDTAIHALEALLGLYPDHYWATVKLIELYGETGQEQEALDYRIRLADLRPNNFLVTTRLVYDLVLDGDLSRAKTYVKRALDLITPKDLEKNPEIPILLMWFPAFEALLRADPETALREADRSLETLRSFQGRDFANYPNALHLNGAFYLTLGKIGLAREWSEKVEDTGLRPNFTLASIAYIEDDQALMTQHLEQFLNYPKLSPIRPGFSGLLSQSTAIRCCIPLLLARGGFLSEAEEWLSNLRTSRPMPELVREAIETRREIVRGVLTLSRGNRIEGMKMLEETLSLFVPRVQLPAFFMGSEILAEAWREQGNLDKAVQVLEAALEKETLLLLFSRSMLSGGLWLKIQNQLAQLYREMGRDEDARKIEEKLRRSLALADPDHPILRQLERTKELASLESAK
jgi:tetratricopeptide (TPR) repeat protein